MAEKYYKVSDLPIGSKIVMGKSKFVNKFQNGEEEIIWVILSNKHSDIDSYYPANAVTMITEKVIRYMAFDAKEPANTIASRKIGGNNRYLTSNIRQWLNSDGASGQWFVPQNVGTSGKDNKDVAPNAINILNTTRSYPYDTDEGFMNWFSPTEKVALLKTKIKTTMPIESEGGVADSPELEITNDYFYLPSLTEVTGSSYTYNVAYPQEGSKIFESNSVLRNAKATPLALTNSIYYTNNASTNKDFIFRSTGVNSQILKYVDNGLDGTHTLAVPNANHGIRPMTNIKDSTIVVKQSDGTYRMVDNVKPSILIDSVSNFDINFRIFDYDDFLDNITIEIGGQLVKTYNIANTAKEYSSKYSIPFDKLNFGSNKLTIKAVDTRGEFTVKTMNVELKHKNVITGGERIATKNGSFYIVDAKINDVGVTEITLDRNLANTINKLDVVEKYETIYQPFAFLNEDFKSLPIYVEMELKTIDYDRVKETAIEEWTLLGFGKYCHTKVEFIRPTTATSTDKLSKISQIFMYYED